MKNDDIYQDIDWHLGQPVTDFLPSPAELMNAKTYSVSDKDIQTVPIHRGKRNKKSIPFFYALTTHSKKSRKTF